MKAMFYSVTLRLCRPSVCIKLLTMISKGLTKMIF